MPPTEPLIHRRPGPWRGGQGLSQGFNVALTAVREHAQRCHVWGRMLFLAVWWGVNQSAWPWLWASLSQPVHAVQRVVLLVLAGWGLWDLLTRVPSAQPHPAAPWVVGGCVALAAWAKMATDVHSLQAALALLLGVAWSSLDADQHTWRRRWRWALVLVMCLPVQPHIDAHLGLPLRLWTAQVVAPLLDVVGVPNVSVESIIVTEGRVADVANACSGVRTLWYAMLLWWAARWACPQAPLARWLLAGAATGVTVVVLNALRVATLVWALHDARLGLLAEMAHTTLGLLALVAAVALNVWCCGRPSWWGVTMASPPPPQPATRRSWRARRTELGLLVLMAGLVAVPEHQKHQPPDAPQRPWVWPASLGLEAVPLSPLEHELLAGRGVQRTEKYQFEGLGAAGSLLVIQSSDWRAHHAPELCLLAQGARVEQLRRMATDNGVFRVMTLRTTSSGPQTAITWFQSGERVVPDLWDRWWSQWWHPGERWSLVTIVLDQPMSDSAVLRWHQTLHRVVAQSTGEFN